MNTVGTPSSAPGAVASGSATSLDRWFLRAVAFFAAAVVLHNGDHLRRGADAVSSDVFWLGAAGIVLEVAVVFVVCQRHRIAPLAAAVAGFTLAAGYVAVHFLPGRDWFSDSFTSSPDVSRLSVLAASTEVVAAVTLAVVGLAVLTRQGGVESPTGTNGVQRTVQEAARHPLVLAFAISQAVTLAISFAQR